jgi:hypothetical protein
MRNLGRIPPRDREAVFDEHERAIRSAVMPARNICWWRAKADVHVSVLNSRLGGAKLANIGHVRSCLVLRD